MTWGLPASWAATGSPVPVSTSVTASRQQPRAGGRCLIRVALRGVKARRGTLGIGEELGRALGRWRDGR